MSNIKDLDWWPAFSPNVGKIINVKFTCTTCERRRTFMLRCFPGFTAIFRSLHKDVDTLTTTSEPSVVVHHYQSTVRLIYCKSRVELVIQEMVISNLIRRLPRVTIIKRPCEPDSGLAASGGKRRTTR